MDTGAAEGRLAGLGSKCLGNARAFKTSRVAAGFDRSILQVDALVKVNMARKRRYGSGSIRHRNGTWYIRYRPYPGAKQVEVKVGRDRDGVDASAAEYELARMAIGRSEGRQPGSRLFADTVDDWRKWDRALNDTSRRTQDLDDNLLECHLLPAFGAMHLRQIGHRELEAYLANKLTRLPSEEGAFPVVGKHAQRRTKPLSRRYLEQHLTVLNKVFEWAEREGRVSSNPVALVSWRQVRSYRRKEAKPEPLEQEQVRALLLYSRDEERELQVLMLAKLGLRLGELLSLYVDDYAPAGRQLSIRRTLTREGSKTVIGDYPKTGAGDRILTVSSALGMRIERQVSRATARASKSHRREVLLFPNTVGNIHGEDNYRTRNWRQTIDAYEAAVRKGDAEDVGLDPTITPHRLRHTAASEWIMAGKPDTQIAYWLGHESAAITRKIYAHIFKRAKAEVADLPDLYSHEIAG